MAAQAEEEPGLPQKGPDRTAEIKALLKERCDTLALIVDELMAQYRIGRLDFGSVVQAERAFLRATIELNDSPENRRVVLEKIRNTAKLIAERAEARFKAGYGTSAEVLQAKALLLDARIELLREELKSPPSK